MFNLEKTGTAAAVVVKAEDFKVNIVNQPAPMLGTSPATKESSEKPRLPADCKLCRYPQNKKLLTYAKMRS